MTLVTMTKLRSKEPDVRRAAQAVSHLQITKDFAAEWEQK